MHETLKELAGELAVIHEALERAEVIERQLPAYLRELEAERDELRAELIKVLSFVGGQATEDVSTSFLLNVSEEVSALLAGMAGATAELRAEVERLRVRGDDFRTEMVATALDHAAATARAEAAEAQAADLRGALSCLCDEVEAGDGAQAEAVAHQGRRSLARTPAQSLGRLKAEALRAYCAHFRVLREADDDRASALDDGWKEALYEADRLEATDGR